MDASHILTQVGWLSAARECAATMQEDKPLTPNHPDHPETRSQRGAMRCMWTIWIHLVCLHVFAPSMGSWNGLGPRDRGGWKSEAAAAALIFRPRSLQMGRAPSSTSFGSQKKSPRIPGCIEDGFRSMESGSSICQSLWKSLMGCKIGTRKIYLKPVCWELRAKIGGLHKFVSPGIHFWDENPTTWSPNRFKWNFTGNPVGLCWVDGILFMISRKDSLESTQWRWTYWTSTALLGWSKAINISSGTLSSWILCTVLEWWDFNEYQHTVFQYKTKATVSFSLSLSQSALDAYRYKYHQKLIWLASIHQYTYIYMAQCACACIHHTVFYTTIYICVRVWRTYSYMV